jgi:hypothetical protein
MLQQKPHKETNGPVPGHSPTPHPHRFYFDNYRIIPIVSCVSESNVVIVLEFA